MTYSDFKHSDLHKCLSTAGELLFMVGKYTLKIFAGITKFIFWLAAKAYYYVMK
ncbi:hypothetical protein J4N42_17450 [Vibrio sp. SCSIO 43135]|uniref:hypothetical protein n=1 Tax=Vibrio sp. SCSIO 43135 TaxID=2819096 RepID=UPI002075C4EB|nr:hypothetical protein [Vibrio sp. SCSIO 43135]USD43936.1 hypothetical protein J4N42_17450 [Vibrio sp. SCSIO 43135]